MQNQGKKSLILLACEQLCGDRINSETMNDYNGIHFPQVGLIFKALQQRGINIRVASWQQNINWTQHKLLIGPIWDYPQYAPKFLQFLQEIKRLDVKIVNSIKFVEWNMSKKYLLDLIDYDIAIPEAMLFGKDYQFGLKEAFYQYEAKYNISDVIIKGVVDANGEGYLHINEKNLEQARLHFQLLQQKNSGVIMQRFAPEVGTKGELSFVFFSNKLSHLFLKVPSSSEQRVQPIYGGKFFPIKRDLSDFQAKTKIIKQTFRQDFSLNHLDMTNALNFAEKILVQLSKLLKAKQIQEPSYLRMDCVYLNGQYKIMQLQGIQPYLCMSQTMKNDPSNDVIANYIEGVVLQLL